MALVLAGKATKEVQPGQAQRSSAQRNRSVNIRVMPYFLLAPFGMLFATAVVAPLVYAIYTSLFTHQLIGGTTFAWFANYKQALGSPILWGAIARVLAYGAVEVPVMLGLALGFATVVDLGLTLWGPVWRIVYFLPYAVPAAVSTLMWGFMLEPHFGPFDQIANYLGLSPPQFLSPSGILPSVGVISLWETVGFNMLIFYTALRGIPPELTEAAVLDGAKLRDVIWRVRLPLLKKAAVLTLFLALIGTLQLFTEPFLLATVSGSVNSNLTPNMYIYQSAFSAEENNYAAAVSIILAALAALAVLVALVVRRRVTTSRISPRRA
jgi:multiple sugar transport system permease protein